MTGRKVKRSEAKTRGWMGVRWARVEVWGPVGGLIGEKGMVGVERERAEEKFEGRGLGEVRLGSSVWVWPGW